MIQDKAQSEENGKVLFTGCNAVFNYPRGSLRASREAVARCIAPLGKGLTFPAARAFRPTASQLAEAVNTTLQEH